MLFAYTKIMRMLGRTQSSLPFFAEPLVMAVTKSSKCPKCFGLGKTGSGKTCPRCKGTGEVEVRSKLHTAR